MTPPAISDAGVDTVSFAFRSASERPLDAMRATPHRWAGGSLVADERGPGGGRVLCWPANGVIAIETRLGALLAGDAEDHSLQPARLVRSGATAARLVVSDVIGADPGDLCEVRRFDLASELRFDAPEEGIAFLRTLQGMCPPRAQVTVHRADDGTPMTVYVRTAGRGVVQSRAYDKGRESGSDPPGLRVRLESQNRPRKAKRYSPDVLADLDLSTMFGRTMRHYLSERAVVTAGPDAAVTHLVAKAARGELSHARAERLAGVVAIVQACGRGAYYDPENRKASNDRSSRRLRALREAGISLDDLPSRATVPVGELLAEAIDGFTA